MHADAQQPQSMAGSQDPPKLGGAEIRERFLQFYEKNQHVRLPSSSLIPDDPTVLLTIAGMLQFKSIFMGLVRQARQLLRFSLHTLMHACIEMCRLTGNTNEQQQHRSVYVQMTWRMWV